MHQENIRCKRGFTLVELVIVIIILGILSALTIPLFGNESHTAQLSVLEQNVSLVQQAIHRYYLEHRGEYPAFGLPNGSTKRPAQDPGKTFLAQILTYTDVNGNPSNTKDATFKFGPYLQSIPENPLARDPANPASVFIFDSAAAIAPAGGRNAWRYSWRTVEFIYNLTSAELAP